MKTHFYPLTFCAMLILLLLTAAGLGACTDAPNRTPEATETPANAPDEGFQDPTDRAMRGEIMEDQLTEVSVLQHELTGTWRTEARRLLLDFEGRRYDGYTPTGQPLAGDLRIVDEGDDYVIFEVDGETLTARVVGEGELLLSTSPEDTDGLRFRR